VADGDEGAGVAETETYFSNIHGEYDSQHKGGECNYEGSLTEGHGALWEDPWGNGYKAVEGEGLSEATWRSP